MKYAEELTLKTGNCDFTGRWKLSDIMIQFQELAGAHCDRAGCGRRDMLEKYSVVWILTRSEIRMARYPLLGERVRIETFTHPNRKVFFPRSYRILDEAGTELGSSLTYWVLCDIHTRKITYLPQIASLFPDSGIPSPITRFMDIPDTVGEKTVLSRQPLYTDLDVNRHVNNTRYADWLSDMLGPELLERQEIGDFMIDYHHEVRPGQQLELSLWRDGERFTMAGRCGDVLHFNIGGTLSPSPQHAML